MAQAVPKATFSVVSLGCAKNLVDTERMLGLLVQEGYVLVPDPAEAELVIVNTCGFIDEARQESMQAIQETALLKRDGHCRGLVVAGCLAERQKHELVEAVPEIDAVVGVFAREEIVAVCDRLVAEPSKTQAVFRPPPTSVAPETARLRVTPRHLAYLKISEGCDRGCTFCSIPLMRGPQHSKPIEHCVAEARELAGDGVRELCVIAQDTTAYGLDLYGRPRLADLLAELSGVDGLHWIRLLYAYPEHITDALLDVMAAAPTIVPYIDLPLQHISDRLLRRMGRGITRAQTERLLARIRDRLPDVTLRTTLLVGFPGETDEEFEELVDFVRDVRFDRLGCFAYSLEPGTAAARLPDPVSDDVRDARFDELMRAQQQIAFEKNREWVGQTLEVVIDESVEGTDVSPWLARSRAHAPDIDGHIRVTAGRVHAGQFIRAEIMRADGYDLWAEARPPRTRHKRRTRKGKRR